MPHFPQNFAFWGRIDLHFGQIIVVLVTIILLRGWGIFCEMLVFGRDIDTALTGFLIGKY